MLRDDGACTSTESIVDFIPWPRHVAAKYRPAEAAAFSRACLQVKSARQHTRNLNTDFVRFKEVV